MEHQIVGRTPDGLFPYQAWPTVARDKCGVLYAAASGHRLGHVCPFGKNYLYISRDEGNTWEGPLVANDTVLDDRDAGLCVWGNGRILLTWFNLPPQFYSRRAADPKAHNDALRTPLGRGAMEQWAALPSEQFRRGAFARLSRDGGQTWSEPVSIPLTSPHGPVPADEGRLLYIGKEMSWGHGLEPGAVYAMESTDEGLSWDLLGAIPCPQGYDWGQIHEPHGIRLAEGTVLAALRIEDPTAPGKLLISLSRSEDGGRTFTQPEILDLLGSPPHLMQHSSGAVVLSYSKRVPGQPFGSFARISRDGGKTWSEEVPAGAEAPDWDHGYPSTVELSDGSLLTVYYQKHPGDTFNSILSTRWTLPEA